METTTKPEGKGLGIAGFVIALVGLIFASWMAAISAVAMASGGSAAMMYIWLVVCVLSIVLSVMGMKKLGQTGGKKGLAIAGLVIGIVATVYSLILVLGLSAASTVLDGAGDEFKKEMERALEQSMQGN